MGNSLARLVVIFLSVVVPGAAFWGGLAFQRAGMLGQIKRLFLGESAYGDSQGMPDVRRSVQGHVAGLRKACIWLLIVTASFCGGIVAQRTGLPRRVRNFLPDMLLNIRVGRLLADEGLPRNTWNPVAVGRLNRLTIQPTQPILVVVDSRVQPLGTYLGEILLAEGFNQFQTAGLSQIQPGTLEPFGLVVLAPCHLRQDHVNEIERYLAGGGNLIALRPDKALSRLLGLTATSATLEGGYVRLSTNARTAGLTDEPLQFYGVADAYELNGAEPLAYLLADSGSQGTMPAITRYRHEQGTAVCFAYDLLRSVMCLRQGDPHRASCSSTSKPPDLFANILDRTRGAIPQADIHQHILSNLVLELTDAINPMPRWYPLPAGARSLLVMTGDGCARPTKEDIEEQMDAVEQHAGKMTFYFYFGDFPTMGGAHNARWLGRGHATSIHPCFSGCSTEKARAAIRRDTGAYRLLYGHWPRTVRMHCLRWAGYADQAKICASAGIRMDLTYVSWASCMPIYMSGSAIPMRFVDPDTGVIDVYQQPTQFEDDILMNPVPYGYALSTDEATEQSIGALRRSMEQFHTPIVLNVHPANYVRFSGDWARRTMAYAQGRCIPIWSAEQWLGFWEAREQAEFTEISFEQGTLQLTVKAHRRAERITLMLPACSNGMSVRTVRVGDKEQAYALASVWGKQYAMADVSLATGAVVSIQADYEPSAPAVTRGVGESFLTGLAKW